MADEIDDVRAVFADLISEVHEMNVAVGWFDEHRTFDGDIALLHSEVSEMFDAWREHGFEDATDPVETVIADAELFLPPKPEGVGSEAADILIRLLDTVYRHDIDIVAEYRRKIGYNRTRPYRHGGKLL